jgi:nucleoside phosphorylase
VPRGAEATAVRRGVRGARVVELPAGAAAASALPGFRAGETVVVLGLCGALRGLRAGDVAVYGRVVDAARTVDLDDRLIGALTSALPGATVVDACTTKHVVTLAAARAVLAQRFGADVVDMEATHLAAALGARGVPFAMVRVVSDDAARDLPRIEDAVDAAGRIRPLRLALAFARAPRAAVAFLRNVRGALAMLSDTARTIAPMQ